MSSPAQVDDDDDAEEVEFVSVSYAHKSFSNPLSLIWSQEVRSCVLLIYNFKN